jgi:hypothetical protein
MVELLPAGWRQPGQLDDRIVIESGGLRVRIDGRTGFLAADRLARARVWQDRNGRHCYRLEDASGQMLAVLVEEQWRLPAAGLAPLLGQVGCPIRAGAAAEKADSLPTQRLARAGRRWWPPTAAWVAVAAVVVILAVTTADVIKSRTTLARYDELVTVAVAIYLALLAASRQRYRPPAGASVLIQPAAGGRGNWGSGAGLGRLGRSLVAADGWGQWAVWPSDGPGAVTAVAADDDGAVLVDPEGRAAGRLPYAGWARPDEDGEEMARRVANALDVPVASTRPPSGGEELTGPVNPLVGGRVTGWLLAASPLLVALLLALDIEAGLARTALAVLCVGGLMAILAAIGRLLAARPLLEPAAQAGRLGMAKVLFPVWSEILLLVLLLIEIVSPVDLPPLLVLTIPTLVGGLGVALALLARQAAFSWRIASLVPGLVAGLLGLVHPGQPVSMAYTWPAVLIGIAAFVAGIVVSAQLVRDKGRG